MSHAPNEDSAILDITQLGLWNLLNELRKIDQMRGSLSNKFTTFNKTIARMLDSIHHMTPKLLKIACLA